MWLREPSTPDMATQNMVRVKRGRGSLAAGSCRALRTCTGGSDLRLLSESGHDTQVGACLLTDPWDSFTVS